MTQVIKPQTTTLYDRDLALWIKGTIDQLKARNFEELDIENLIEELEGLAGRDRRELESRIAILLEHLLKRCYVKSEYDYNGWEETIERSRFEIKQLLKQSPSLKRHGNNPELFEELYSYSLGILQKKTDYNRVNFPDTWQFSKLIDDLLNVNFWE